MIETLNLVTVVLESITRNSLFIAINIT